jgi:hypothetical protein
MTFASHFFCFNDYLAGTIVTSSNANVTGHLADIMLELAVSPLIILS